MKDKARVDQLIVLIGEASSKYAAAARAEEEIKLAQQRARAVTDETYAQLNHLERELLKLLKWNEEK